MVCTPAALYFLSNTIDPLVTASIAGLLAFDTRSFFSGVKVQNFSVKYCAHFTRMVDLAKLKAAVDIDLSPARCELLPLSVAVGNHTSALLTDISISPFYSVEVMSPELGVRGRRRASAGTKIVFKEAQCSSSLSDISSSVSEAILRRWFPLLHAAIEI